MIPNPAEWMALLDRQRWAKEELPRAFLGSLGGEEQHWPGFCVCVRASLCSCYGEPSPQSYNRHAGCFVTSSSASGTVPLAMYRVGWILPRWVPHQMAAVFQGG
ncbi:hypothetical protein LZ30DRAFT_455911 [Colletotrichum cereale]|nr:hypothetical protein LZ30DRAFT_455911 [Colletotrichum cereale]